MRSILLIAILHISVTLSVAQADTSRTAVTDTSAVMNQNDVYSQELPKDIGPPKDSVRVAVAALPDKLRRRLQRERQYKGWEESEIYLNQNTHLYMIYFIDSARVREYVFDNGGKPISVNSFERKKK